MRRRREEEQKRLEREKEEWEMQRVRRMLEGRWRIEGQSYQKFEEEIEKERRSKWEEGMREAEH